NVGELRAAMGSFLRAIDAEARFQPFSKAADLRKHMAEAQVSFLLLNTLYVDELAEHKLRPLLIPLRDGEISYHKVLLVRRGTDPRAIRVVATTSPPPEIAAIAIRGRALDK